MLHARKKNQSINISSSEISMPLQTTQILRNNSQISFKSNDAEKFQMEEGKKNLNGGKFENCINSRIPHQYKPHSASFQCPFCSHGFCKVTSLPWSLFCLWHPGFLSRSLRRLILARSLLHHHHPQLCIITSKTTVTLCHCFSQRGVLRPVAKLSRHPKPLKNPKSFYNTEPGNNSIASPKKQVLYRIIPPL